VSCYVGIEILNIFCITRASNVLGCGDRRTRLCFMGRMHEVSSGHLSAALINDCRRILVMAVVSSPTRPSIRPRRHLHRFRPGLETFSSCSSLPTEGAHPYRPITTPTDVKCTILVQKV
jgi:hypothetical protein